MQITIVPASAQTHKAAIAAVLQHPFAPEVVGIYRNTDKAPADFKDNPRFKVVHGDLYDETSLDFSGSEAVLVLSPPKLDGSDYIAIAERVAQKVCDAITKSGSVRRLVYISSVGAQYEKGMVSSRRLVPYLHKLSSIKKSIRAR